MKKLTSDIENIISNCNNQINDQIFGINYLEKLKYLLIDKLKEKKINGLDRILEESEVLFDKSYGQNNLSITIESNTSPIEKSLNESSNDVLSIVLRGIKSIDIYQSKASKSLHSLKLLPKSGIVLSKNTYIVEKISKDSIILDIANNYDSFKKDINVEI